MSFSRDNEITFVPSGKDKIAAANKIEFTRKEIESVLGRLAERRKAVFTRARYQQYL